MALTFKDVYPPEIVEWTTSGEFLPEIITPERERILAVLEDEEMMRVARPYIQGMRSEATERWQDECDCDRIEAFRRFIEDAARLLDAQPRGTHMRAPGEPLMFSTPSELRKDLAKAQATVLEMVELIGRTAPSLGGCFSLANATQLIAALDAYHTAALNAANEFTLTETPGTKAGKHAMRNWLMREIGLLANLHLRDRAVALVIEVTRVLLEFDDPTEKSTAREILMNTRLVPAEGEWALDEDWKGSTGH